MSCSSSHTLAYIGSHEKEAALFVTYPDAYPEDVSAVTINQVVTLIALNLLAFLTSSVLKFLKDFCA